MSKCCVTNDRLLTWLVRGAMHLVADIEAG